MGEFHGMKLYLNKKATYTYTQSNQSYPKAFPSSLT